MLSQPFVRMATYKTRLQSEKEIQRILEESASEGDVLSESDKSSESECDSDSETEEDPGEKSESSDSDTTTPPPQKITKEEGWRWNVTGDIPSKLHFTGNPGIKPAIIWYLPPEPNPLEDFQLMVHDSRLTVGWNSHRNKQVCCTILWQKSQFPYNKTMVPYNFPWNKSLLCIMCPHVPSEKTKFAILLEHP